MAWSISYTLPAAEQFPLSLDASGRFLVTAQGNPFLLVGEAAWTAPHNMASAAIDAYIADRSSRGFTAVMMMLMCHAGTVAPGICADNNANGEPAFSNTPWLTPGNINEAYWAYVDEVIHKFHDAGMACLIAPAYENTSWGSFTTSDTIATNWGAWVGARYNVTDFPNIIWVAGGDQRAITASRRNAMHIAIYNNGGTQLHTVHNDRFHDGFEEKSFYADGDTWLLLNSVYCDDGSTNGTPFTIPEQCIAEYGVAGPFPFFLIEDWYADEHSMTDPNVIAEKWQAMCSGACGANIGTLLIWQTATGYADEFGSVANVGMTRLQSLLLSYPWQTLVPKQDASLVSSSLGTQGPSRICPALGTGGGGKFALVFVPTATSPTVVMTNFTQSSVRARWYDIGDGSFTNVSGQPFANTGSQSMTHPGNNSLATSHWVLVLD